MGDKPYPVPTRLRWETAVEFLDGTRIEAASDADVLERWGRLLGWSESRYLAPSEVKERAARFARGFYEASLPDGVEELPDDAFLDVLADSGCIVVIRR